MYRPKSGECRICLLHRPFHKGSYFCDECWHKLPGKAPRKRYKLKLKPLLPWDGSINGYQSIFDQRPLTLQRAA
jgi:hypothetical protein